jgi:hypothetical protein
MFDALDITEEEAAGLAELAQLELATAREFSARARAAEDPALANGYARTAHRAARSYRQCLALKVRLKRDLQRAAREAPPPKPQPSPQQQRIAARVAHLRDALERVIWDEHERADSSMRQRYGGFARDTDQLRRWLDRLSEKEGFGDQPLDDHVVEVARVIGVSETTATRWRDLRDPPDAAYLWEGDPGDEDWDSG